MKSVLDDVQRFHEKFNIPNGTSFPNSKRRMLRVRLLEEEFEEYCEAEDEDDLVGIADALADMVYIICGTAIEYNIPLDRVWAEVQRSNMTKTGDSRPDGKILKGEEFEEPKIREILDEHFRVS